MIDIKSQIIKPALDLEDLKVVASAEGWRLTDLRSLHFFLRRNFKYRRKITITEQSGNNLSDYQVRIDLDATNFDFSHFLNEGKDLRFTDASKNLLPYWVEKMDIAAQEATIWVKVPSIPANSSVDIFMYYGSPEVDSASDISNTAILGDDFVEALNSAEVKARYKAVMDRILEVVEEDFASHGGTGQIGDDTDDVRSQEVCSFYAYMYVLDGDSTILDHCIKIINWAIDNLQTTDGAFLEDGIKSYARTGFFTWEMMFSYLLLEDYLDSATKTKWLNSAREACDWLYAQDHPDVTNQVMAEMLAHYLYYKASGDSTYLNYAQEHRDWIIANRWVQETDTTGYFTELGGWDSVYNLVQMLILMWYRYWSGDTAFDTYLQQMWNKERLYIDFETLKVDTSGNTRVTETWYLRYPALEGLYGVVTDPDYDWREIHRRSAFQILELDLFDNGIVDKKGFDHTVGGLLKGNIPGAYFHLVETPDYKATYGAFENPANWKIVGTDGWLLIKSSGKLYIETPDGPPSPITLYSSSAINENNIAVEVKMAITKSVDANIELIGIHVQDNAVDWTDTSLYYVALKERDQQDEIAKLVSGAKTSLSGARSRTVSMDYFYRQTFRRINNTLKFKDDTIDWLSGTDGDYTSGYVCLACYEAGCDYKFIFVRKYTEPEPSVSIGEEETA